MFLRAAGKRKQQLFCTFETVKNNLREKKKIFYQVITPFMRTFFFLVYSEEIQKQQLYLVNKTQNVAGASLFHHPTLLFNHATLFVFLCVLASVQLSFIDNFGHGY